MVSCNPAGDRGRLRQIALSEMDLASPNSDGVFDPIARIAQRLAGSPRAFVTLLDAEAVWLKGAAGADGRVLHRETFCHHAIESHAVMCVADLADDPRFADTTLPAYNPLHAAYIGAPIILSDGLCIGVVCAAFDTPQTFDAGLKDSLADLACAVAAQCERRRDMARLTQAQRVRATADTLLSTLMDHAPVALALVDRNMRYVRVNPRFRAEMGMGDTDLSNRLLDETFPDLVRRWPDALSQCLSGAPIRGDAIRTQRFDGAEICIRLELVPWRGAEGEVDGILVMTHDVTDLMTSLRETERSEERLKLAVDIANQLVFDCDIRTGVFYHMGSTALLSHQMPTLVRGPQDMLVGIHPDDRGRVMAEWRLCHADQRGQLDTEYRIETDSGVRWVTSTSKIFSDRSGRPTRLLGVLKDVTEQKRDAAAMADARDQAETANRAKTEFLANMSHEIRTPLNGILGVAGALAATRLSRPQQEMVGLIETSAVALERLLSDVLDLARVESGRMDLQIEPFDLLSLLAGLAALFEPPAREKGVGFVFESGLGAHNIYLGDASRLRQILSNLLSNAVKFTSDGEVRLEVSATPGADPGRQRLQFRISDTGIGFKAADKHRLFERFEQADGSVTRKFGGSGLGLAISRTLAERMCGSLDAEPGPGGGAVFTLELDLELAMPVEQMEGPAAAPPADDAPQRPLRILLAEDHPVNRRVVELVLDAIEVDLTSVDDGAAAVRQWETGAFDIVLMDLQMPVMDGLSAIRAIRAREAESGRLRTPILALTANAMPEHVKATAEAGADGHISKPIRAPELLAAVVNTVAEARAAQDAPPPAARHRHSG